MSIDTRMAAESRSECLPGAKRRRPQRPIEEQYTHEQIMACRTRVIPPRAPGETDLYFIGAKRGPIKIGQSANPKNRLAQIQTGYPYKLQLLAVVPSGGEDELYYHVLFHEHRLSGEWFRRVPTLVTLIERFARKYPA